MSLLKKDLSKNLKTTLYWFFQATYEPKEFWEKWGETFHTEPAQLAIYPQHQWILKHLIRIKPKTFLEAGCGFGRNIKFLADNYPFQLKVTGCDMSSTMLENAKNFLKGMKFGNLKPQLLQTNILDLPFKSKSFDVVLIHGVLMHIKPQDVKRAVSEAVRVAKKYLIVVEQNFSAKKPNKAGFIQINKYTFAHDYAIIFPKFGCDIVELEKKEDLDWMLIKKNALRSI